MDPKKILGFAVYYFIALNLSTLIVVQFSIELKYSWMVYAGTMFIATLPCVYLVQGTTVLEIASGIAAGLGGLFVFPVAAVAATGAAAAGAAATGAAAAAALTGAAAATLQLPESDDENNDGNTKGLASTLYDQITASSKYKAYSPFDKYMSPGPPSGGRRGKKRRGRGRVGNGIFAIPLY
jgi:hypothetical protein